MKKTNENSTIKTLKSKEESLMKQLESVRSDIKKERVIEQIERLDDFVLELNCMLNEPAILDNCKDADEHIYQAMEIISKTMERLKEEHGIED